MWNLHTLTLSHGESVTFLLPPQEKNEKLSLKNISWNQLSSINVAFTKFPWKKCEWGVKYDLDWKIDSFSVKSTFLLKKLHSRNFDYHRILWYFFVISTMWLLSLPYFFCSYLESFNPWIFTLVCKLKVERLCGFYYFSWFGVGINENIL